MTTRTKFLVAGGLLLGLFWYRYGRHSAPTSGATPASPEPAPSGPGRAPPTMTKPPSKPPACANDPTWYGCGGTAPAPTPIDPEPDLSGWAAGDCVLACDMAHADGLIAWWQLPGCYGECGRS